MSKKSSESQAQKKQLINAHTHVFTGNFVPPFLARSIVPWPLYYLLHVGFVIRLFKAYYSWRNRMYGPRKNLKRRRVLMHNFIRSKPILNLLYRIVLLWLGVVATLIFIEWFRPIVSPSKTISAGIDTVLNWMKANYLYFDLHWVLKLIWFLLIFIFVKWSRNFLLFIVKNIWGFLKKLPNETTLALLNRYLLLGRFAFYKKQVDVAERALHQLPLDSGIVILPMDMEYMGAGKTKMPKALREIKKKMPKGWTDEDFTDVYKYQMRDLWKFTKAAKNASVKTVNSRNIGEDKTFAKTMTKWEIPASRHEKLARLNKMQLNDQLTKGMSIKIKPTHYYPFLFLDPRRIAEENKLAAEHNKLVEERKSGEKKELFFDYEPLVDGQKMKLKPCFVKTYMEDRRFSGFKIYPALGYYPFDEHLLPIWRYAQENDIPIMTHCVKGVVYYRGPKKEEWNNHPIFRDEFDYTLPMLLPEVKNIDFQINFTHPMNYLCLVEERLLREVVKKTSSESPIRKLFPFDEKEEKLTTDLSQLKICLAHFGGEGEWTRYMEQDREVYSQRLLREPGEGINFLKTKKGKFSWNKLHKLWHKADWYSIICSMMIDYQNIYADISYIISKESIYPLLKYTLEKGEHFEQEMDAYEKEEDPIKKSMTLTGKNKLRSRVLFGTDFYVVRNHHSDKDLFIQTKSLLSEEQFDQITRENTHTYLQRSYSEPEPE